MKSKLILLSASILCESTGFAVTVEYFDNIAFINNNGSVETYGFDNFAEGTTLSGTEISGFVLSARRITVVNPQDFAPGLDVGGANLNSQPQGISASLFYSSPDIIGFDNLDDNFNITFSVPTKSAGLWLGNLGAFAGDAATQTQVTFFDDQGIVIADEILNQGHPGILGSGLNNRIFYGISSNSFIERIEIRNGSSDNDGILLDDLQFAAVPEPSSCGLILGCAGIAFALRRRS
jgi:hypothetical protein